MSGATASTAWTFTCPGGGTVNTTGLGTGGGDIGSLTPVPEPGTWALFAATLKHFGVEVRFVDPADPELRSERRDPDVVRCRS